MVFQEIHPALTLILIFLPTFVHRTIISRKWKDELDRSENTIHGFYVKTNKDFNRELIGLPYSKHWRYWNSQITIWVILFFPFEWLWEQLTSL